MMTYQEHILMHTPQFTTWSAYTRLYCYAHVLSCRSLEPGTTSSNGMKCMRIAVANLGPTIHLPINSHCQSIGINTTKTRIPCFKTIKPDIITLKNPIQYFALAAMTKERIEWVSNDRKPSLLMHKINTTLNTQIGRNPLFNKERQHMTFSGADLFSYNKIKVKITSCPEITRPQSAFNYIMIGQRNHIQICIILDVMQNLLNCAKTIAIGTVHM